MSSTISIQVKTMTLTKEDIKELSLIAVKVIKSSSNEMESKASIDYIHIHIDGGKEKVTTDKPEKLLDIRWPKNVEGITINAKSYTNEKEIYIRLENEIPLGSYRITVSGNEDDWVSGRIKELEYFIETHRNNYWIIHNWILLFIQIIGLSILTLMVLNNKTINLPVSYRQLILFASLYIWPILYYLVIRKIYPFILFETGIPSNIKTIRRILCWFILIIIAAIIGEVILNLVK
jgi:hypothetical protein